jgi:molybdopterin-guanine dinucleotide biosynthesis protein A
MSVRSDVSALILAGGRATRFGGVDKRELVIDGRTIFDRQVAALLPCVSEIIVSSPRPVAGYRTVADVVAGVGPLAGVAAGLAAARTPWVLVVAGDMPHVSSELVELVVAQIRADIDAVAIRIGSLPEPLFCALRCTTCAPVVERRIASGQRKASKLLTDDDLRVAWIDESAVRAIDPELRALFNVNAPEDLR